MLIQQFQKLLTYLRIVYNSTEYKFGRLFYVSKQKLLHILFRFTLSELVMGNSSNLLWKITFKQHDTRDQSLTSLRLSNI